MHEMQAQQWRYLLEQLAAHKGGMSGEAQAAVRTWITAILDEREWSAGRLAKEAKVAPSTITRALDPKYQYVPSTRTLSKIAAAVNRVAPEIASEGLASARPIGRRIPVMGQVRAGAWIDVVDDPEPLDWLYFDDPEYEKARIYALEVVGRSMDRAYAEGALVIVVDTKDAGVHEGDHVIVRRTRNGSVETTLKEVVVEPEGIALWPRSTHPDHQEPIRISRAPHSDDGVEIIAVVIGVYQKRPRRGAGRIVGI